MSDLAGPGLAARGLALDALERILCRGQTLAQAQTAQRSALARLDAGERAFAEQLVRTVLRRKGQTERLLAGFLNRPLPKKACRAQMALLMGAAQLLFMRTPAHAAIDTTVRLLKKEHRTRGFSGLANALLRRLAREGARRLERVPETLNFPHWLRERWKEAWGEAALRAMAAELVRPPALDLTLKEARRLDVWMRRLKALVLPTGSLRVERPSGPVSALPGYEEGAWWVQDAAAALPVMCMGPVAGAEVADLCAAPGGKTLQLAARGARVTAVDISAKRLERLRANLARTGLTAEVVTADVRAWAPPRAFDAVLLDAPCTASGTFRRHPDVLHLKTEEQLRELVALQRELLARAAAMLRPGGILLYCVCSLLPEEGEEQIARFLKRAGGAFERLPIRAGEIGGLSHMLTAQGEVRTLPHAEIGPSKGMDGFFIARLRKRAA